MNRSRLAWIALSAAAVAARGALAPRIAKRRTAATGEGRDEGGVPSSGVGGGEPPARSVPVRRVPWLAAQADSLFAGLAAASLLATVGMLVWQWSGRALPAAMAGTTLAAVLGTGVIWAVYLMWKVPQWQAAGRAARGGLDERELFEIENAARGTLGQILSGVAVLAGLLFGWQQLGNTNENLQVSQEGQITDRFARAVEQLGSEDPTVRIGAVYALERISLDSARDHRPVIEVLSAFVRNEPEGGASPVAGEDVQGTVRGTEVRAALGVIGRRDSSRDGGGECLNLFGARLTGIDMAGANLTRTCFLEADLGGATFTGADLRASSFMGADLTRANFGEADATDGNFREAILTQANLIGADLSGASLTGADLSFALLDGTTNLSGADLNGAILDNAILFGVDLSQARSLSSAQLATALIDDRTLLPPGVGTPVGG